MIELHRDWMAEGFSPVTVEDACQLLARVDRDLAERQTANGDTAGGLAVAWPEELAGWLARPKRDGQRRSSQTLSTYRQHLQRFYWWAVRHGWMTYDPSTDLIAPKVHPPLPQPATDEQVARIVREAADPHWLHCVLAAYAGFRPSDIAAARREHFTEQTISVRGKGDKPAILPCDALIWDTVRDLPPGPIARRPDALRVSRNVDEPVTAQQVTNDTCSYLHRTLAMDITLRSLRAWYATTMMERYRDARVVQELMRHSSLQTLQRYAAVVEARKRAALLTLPHFGGRRGAADAGDADRPGRTTAA